MAFAQAVLVIARVVPSGRQNDQSRHKGSQGRKGSSGSTEKRGDSTRGRIDSRLAGPREPTTTTLAPRKRTGRFQSGLF